MRVYSSCLFTLTLTLWSGYSILANGYERLNDTVEHDVSNPGDGVIGVVQRRGLLKVGVGLFEPWVMCDTGGELIGYEIDVAKKLASDLGVRIGFAKTDWYFIIPALIEDNFDLIISGMAITPARGLLVNFTIPYSEFGTLVLINTDELERPESLADLNVGDVVFGARAGTVPEQVVRDRFPNATLRLFDSDDEMLSALIEGDIQAVSADQIKATGWLNEYSDQLDSPFELMNKVPEAIALRKQDFDSLNFLNGWLEHYTSNGWLADRRHYWFETREWEELVSEDTELTLQCEESFTSPFG
ncbi:MAG: transporter substrate-binding domain-containing protein [Gammaproteobacteria bacterium]|nr:transporter substrate-binding domain-containing protein [Gammaproteobacteria bacterium]